MIEFMEWKILILFWSTNLGIDFSKVLKRYKHYLYLKSSAEIKQYFNDEEFCAILFSLAAKIDK